jgi:hypothetical protein
MEEGNSNINLKHCKNLCKCHIVSPPSTTMKIFLKIFTHSNGGRRVQDQSTGRVHCLVRAASPGGEEHCIPGRREY